MANNKTINVKATGVNTYSITCGTNLLNILFNQIAQVHIKIIPKIEPVAWPNPSTSPVWLL
jgi:hypothetical protein